MKEQELRRKTQHLHCELYVWAAYTWHMPQMYCVSRETLDIVAYVEQVCQTTRGATSTIQSGWEYASSRAAQVTKLF